MDNLQPVQFTPLNQLIEPLCDALDTMHKQGSLHRDLKPEDIIIRPDGSPVILDMRTAKIPCIAVVKADPMCIENQSNHQNLECVQSKDL